MCLGHVWIGLKNPVSVSGAFFFFFFHAFVRLKATVHAQQPQSLTFLTLFQPIKAHRACLRVHKFHFSTTFSLKMSSTVLFTYLKIILLQCFSVFSFQFSAISKRTFSLVYFVENLHLSHSLFCILEVKLLFQQLSHVPKFNVQMIDCCNLPPLHLLHVRGLNRFFFFLILRKIGLYILILHQTLKDQ